jgi:hypothetical protein
MTRHNKKRNTGLIYEFLVRTISDAIIEGDDKRRSTALSIVRKHFLPGSELHKEFRLFHSLAATTVQSSSVADTILEAAKKASTMCDENKLNHEKSLLIRSINHGLNDQSFYDRKIPEYKIYATIQTLLNEWRDGSFNNIVMLAQFEEQLKEWLLKDKSVTTINEAPTSSDPLVERLMIKKINERYHDTLTEEQANIIRSYIFAKDDETKKKLSKDLESIKSKALKNIEMYLNENAGKDKYLEEKLNKAKNLIIKENVDSIDDERVERFLDISKLNQELRE